MKWNRPQVSFSSDCRRRYDATRSICACPCPTTCAADKRALWRNARVLRRELMTVLAVRARSVAVGRNPDAPLCLRVQDVLALGSHEQVRRSHARRVVAVMADKKLGWNVRSGFQENDKPRRGISRRLALSADVKLSVAALGLLPSPRPATVAGLLLNERPESLASVASGVRPPASRSRWYSHKRNLISLPLPVNNKESI